MRDPERIDPLLDLLRVAWKRSPDLRLCQLISNLAYKTMSEEQRKNLAEQAPALGFIPRFDPFHVEDDVFLQALWDWINENAPRK